VNDGLNALEAKLQKKKEESHKDSKTIVTDPNVQNKVKTIGILLGSTRTNANGLGLEAWLHLVMKKHGFDSHNFNVKHIHPSKDRLTPLVDDTIPAMISGSEYGNEKVKEWGKLVASCDAFIILTP